MNKDSFSLQWRVCISAFCLGTLSLATSGCAGRQAVYAGTGTVLGVEISQNPATQLYQAKFGYNRAELAIVPSNRSAGKKPDSTAGGAKDTAEVLMELRYSGVFNTGPQSGVYQRLAVGRIAVSQPGAAYLMAKGPDGTLDQQTAQAISRNILSIRQADTSAEALKLPLSSAYAAAVQAGPDKVTAFDSAAHPDFPSFSAFLLDPTVPADKVREIVDRLRQKGLFR